MHVIIVGAGLGGLCLAQCLRKQGISFEIFERDQDENSRFQGWAIAFRGYESSLPSWCNRHNASSWAFLLLISLCNKTVLLSTTLLHPSRPTCQT